MLVKPRISMSFAALTAATLMKPMSLVSTASLRHGREHDVGVRVDQAGHERAPAALQCVHRRRRAGRRWARRRSS